MQKSPSGSETREGLYFNWMAWNLEVPSAPLVSNPSTPLPPQNRAQKRGIKRWISSDYNRRDAVPLDLLTTLRSRSWVRPKKRTKERGSMLLTPKATEHHTRKRIPSKFSTIASRSSGMVMNTDPDGWRDMATDWGWKGIKMMLPSHSTISTSFHHCQPNQPKVPSQRTNTNNLNKTIKTHQNEVHHRPHPPLRHRRARRSRCRGQPGSLQGRSWSPRLLRT